MPITSIALRDAIEKGGPANLERIQCEPVADNSPTLKSDLDEFVNRGVIVQYNGGYQFKMQLFHQWMRRRGIGELIATFSDLDAALRLRSNHEQLRIKSAELVDLAARWRMYRSQPVTEDKLRAWLEQFGDPGDQRLMLSILRGLRFVSTAELRGMFRQVAGQVDQGLVQYRESGQRKRNEVLVSYLDGPGKSGALMGWLYAEESRIYQRNVIEKGALVSTLKTREDVQAVVFVDDLVATGDSVIRNLTEVYGLIGPLVSERNLKVVVASAFAHVSGWERLGSTIEQYGWQITPYTCDLLDVASSCFHAESRYFSSDAERERAKELAATHGQKLVRNAPLGYGGLELAIVFEHMCPNNTLPIIWSESSNPPWMPLFKRE